MGEKTGIAWCDATFNPWWGCEKVSPACTHCYAEELSNRFHSPGLWGKDAPRKIASEKSWNEPLRWNRKAEEAGVRRRVFCASMSDVFEDRRDLDAPRKRLWGLIAKTPSLDWLLLTKRPEHVPELMPLLWGRGGYEFPPNIWIGTTVENQEQAEKRIPELLKVPARVRFLSCEPLLWPVFLDSLLTGISWVIIGGESGRSARPMRLDWARSLVAQCRAAGVAPFMKQLGTKALVGYYDKEVRELFREECYDWPEPIGHNIDIDGQPPLDSMIEFETRDAKGGDPSEWPESLRVQEFPEVSHG